MKRVTLLRDFSEDHRISMDIYADNLLKNLQLIPRPEFHFNSFLPVLSNWIRHVPETANLKMRLGRYLDYPHQIKSEFADIYHILDHGYAHLARTIDPSRTVVTVHDLIPLLAGRNLMHGVSSARRNWLSELSSVYLKKVRKIIAISENTKNDLVKYCDCNPDNIEVVYFGLNSSFRALTHISQEELRSCLGLPEPKTRLVLITGDAFYKNQQTSLKVMEYLQNSYSETVKLVRLGAETETWNTACKSSSFAKHIICLENLKIEQLVQLYNTVDCLLFPSWYEGFGLPVLEAMACGTPVVASNAGALPEAVGQAGLSFEPDDVVGLAGGVGRLLEDKNFRQTQIVKGMRHVKQFSWSKNAEQVLGIYEEIAGIKSG